MFFRSQTRRRTGHTLAALTAACTVLTLGSPAVAQAPVQIAPTFRLHGHIAPIVGASKLLGRIAPQQQVRLAIALPLRNQAQLNQLIQRLYDPLDPLVGQFLTPEEFAANFAPTPQDYQLVAQYAAAQGFQIVGTHANRLILDVTAPAAAVEKAFGVHLQNFKSPEGLTFHSPDNDPLIPAALAGKVQAFVGLDTAAVARPHIAKKIVSPLVSPHVGSGPAGGYTPSEFKTAYGLNTVSLTGSGQTMALFELDGYRAADITAYENQYGLTHTPLQNVLVDGASGSAGTGADEVTLDIELMIAVAPGASKLLVYEGPNSTTGVVDTYNKIATDNTAKVVSTSWGLAEANNSASTRSSENSIFQQYAAQGQSIYAAAGDSGAYDNGSSLSVDDPASQPYVVGVGGTTLTIGSGGTYSSETTWSGGGGGISIEWGLPTYQSGAVTSSGSTTARNVPDVSLNADPNTGYSIYYNGSWTSFGGTSCAAPIWAAFTALVNQQRVANGSAVLGFPNTALYPIGKGASYTGNFHDITTGNNQYYSAITGYDVATGWGSFKGATLLSSLAGGGTTGTPPAAPTGLTATAGNAQVSLSWAVSSGATSYTLYRATSSGAETSLITGLTGTSYTNTGLTNGTTYYYKVAAVNSAGTSGLSSEASAAPTAGGGTPQQLLGNPGFENGSGSPALWTVSSGVIDSGTSEAAHGGTWKAWMCGYGSTHTDTLYQSVTIPSTITTATLSFWLHIDTAETTTTSAYDTLKVQVRSSSGTVLATLATYSNLNAATGYAQKSFSLAAYKGQTVQIYLVGAEDSSLQTSFVVDDFALNVQ